MIQLTDEDKQKLSELGVTALYLFGSRAQGIAGPLSDYDFAVLLEDARAANDSEQYSKLYDAVYDVCADLIRVEPIPPPPAYVHQIDMVFLQRARVPLGLRFHVIRFGRVLFDGNLKLRVRFEEQTMEEYCDFRPLLNLFDRAILASI